MPHVDPTRPHVDRTRPHVHRTRPHVHRTLGCLARLENSRNVMFYFYAFSSFQNSGLMSSSNMLWIKQQMLWQRTLQRASLTCAVSVLLRSESPNFDLIIWNVVSTLLRRWYRCMNEV